jgi:hypothetical protein
VGLDRGFVTMMYRRTGVGLGSQYKRHHRAKPEAPPKLPKRSGATSGCGRLPLSSTLSVPSRTSCSAGGDGDDVNSEMARTVSLSGGSRLYSALSFSGRTIKTGQ